MNSKGKDGGKGEHSFTYWFYGLAAVLLILSFVKDKSKTLLSDQDKKAIYENVDKL